MPIENDPIPLLLAIHREEFQNPSKSDSKHQIDESIVCSLEKVRVIKTFEYSIAENSCTRFVFTTMTKTSSRTFERPAQTFQDNVNIIFLQFVSLFFQLALEFLLCNGV